MPDFISTRGTSFRLAESDFFAAGVNCYFLAFCQEQVQAEVLQQVAAAGMNTIRAWAFLDVLHKEPDQPAFQYLADGKIEFNDGPSGLERLDALIERAEQAGIYLVLPLVNNWPDFGGVAFYQRAFNLPEHPAGFFGSPMARAACRRWADHLLTRRNKRTGRCYYDEPAIFAWELANEPRCPNEKASSTLLLEWVHEMSAFLKKLDPNHLIAVGDEGFFNARGRSHLHNGRYGVDTEAFLNLPSIDFGTFHLYPEHWGLRVDGRAVGNWIADHLELGRSAGKPIILEEFGTTHPDRQVIYRRWSQQMRSSEGAGELVWMLGSQHPDVVQFQDKYTLFHPESVSSVKTNA